MQPCRWRLGSGQIHGKAKVMQRRSQFEGQRFRIERAGKRMDTSRQINESTGVDPAELLEERGVKQHRMVLVPFESFNLSPYTFEWALNVAQSTGSELIFLCINQCELSIKRFEESGNRLADLRRLQAQIENCPVPVKLETVTGSAAQLVLKYVDQTKANMIVIPGEPVAPATRATA